MRRPFEPVRPSNAIKYRSRKAGELTGGGRRRTDVALARVVCSHPRWEVLTGDTATMSSPSYCRLTR